MSFFKQWGRFVIMGARAHAKWELDVSNTILGDKRRLFLLVLLTIPIILGILGGFVFADQIGEVLPDTLGGRSV